MEAAANKVDKTPKEVSERLKKRGGEGKESNKTISKKEAADITATETKLADIIDALRGAISVLEHEMKKNPVAFLQVDTNNMAGLIEYTTMSYSLLKKHLTIAHRKYPG